MINTISYGDAISVVYDDERYPLGSRRIQTPQEVKAADSTHVGPRTWVFVYNDEASTAFAQGDLILLDTDYAPWNGIVCGTAAVVKGRILGIAGHAIAAGSYGWIVRSGNCEAKGDGSVAQGDALASHTSGQVDTLDSTTAAELMGQIGMALEADGSAGELFTIDLNLG